MYKVSYPGKATILKHSLCVCVCVCVCGRGGGGGVGLRPFQEYFTYIEPIVHQRWVKAGEPGEKTNWLSISRTWFSHLWPELEPQRWKTYWIKSQLSYPLGYGGPRSTVLSRHRKKTRWEKTIRHNHYENMPIRIYWKFHHQKMKIFRYKNSDIFHFSAQNINCGYSLEPPRRGGSNEYPQSMFLSRNKKINVYPCKPQFYYIKVGVKGGPYYIGMFSWWRYSYMYNNQHTNTKELQQKYRLETVNRN